MCHATIKSLISKLNAIVLLVESVQTWGLKDVNNADASETNQMEGRED
jgi:hypothetical protein